MQHENIPGKLYPTELVHLSQWPLDIFKNTENCSMPGGGKALTVTTPHGLFILSPFVAFLSVRSSQISKGEKSTHALIFATFTPPSVVRELHNREEEEMSSTSSSRFSSDKSNGGLSSRGPKLTPRPSPRLSQTPSPRPSLGGFYKSTNAITIILYFSSS